MYKKLLLFALSSAGSLYAFDLKLINNSSYTHKIKVSSYKGVREEVRDTATATGHGKLLKLLFCPATADLNAFFQKYSSYNYEVAVKPHSSLVIQDLMPQEKVEAGGTLLWHEVPLDQVKRLTQKAPFKQKVGTFLPSYKKHMALIVFTPTTTGFSFDTCFKATTSRTEPCTSIEDAYRSKAQRPKITPIK